MLSGKLPWSLFNLFFICLYQQGLILLFTLPMLLAFEGLNSPLGMLDYLAATLMMSFLIIETMADQQQYAFQTEKYRRIQAGTPLNEYAHGFVNTGLWGVVRHPNYACEQLIWKSFYDPDFGILNKILNRSGMMSGLNFLDGAMPRLATWMRPGIEKLWPIFGSTGGLILFGAFLLLFSAHGPEQKRRLSSAGLVIAASLLPFLVTRTPVAWWIAVLAFLILMVVLALQLGAKWVLWFFLLLAGLILHHGPGKDPHYLTLFGNVLFAAGLSEFIRSIRERFDAEAFLKTCGWIAMISGVVLILFGHLWTQPIGQFDQGAPAWLGNKDLVIPALLFWGFPWVGTMGVLIYLAGLQQIPTDVYEAAEIDGIGPIGMLFRIELPLILTQVRINLIFMTIGTLTGYEMFLILLGPNGGPGNRGMVPGLYMFKKAFLENQFGYACALGMVLFVIILGLTVIYNKYVKVEK
jgi:ABC-type sugar transport system permease subunit